MEIRDSGHGIPEEHMARLFEPFFTTKDVGGRHLGSGLFICHRHRERPRRALDRAGSIESSPGSGSVFRVILPSSASLRNAWKPQSSAQSTGCVAGRILVGDDDTLVAKALSRLLAEHHEVVAHTSAGDAVIGASGWGERFDHDLLRILTMPVTTGVEFHERLREPVSLFRSREYTIFFTGGAFTDAFAQVLETTANDRLGEAFDLCKFALDHRPLPGTEPLSGSCILPVCFRGSKE